MKYIDDKKKNFEVITANINGNQNDIIRQETPVKVD